MSDLPRTWPQIALFDAGPGEIAALGEAGAIDWLVCRPCAPDRYEFLRGDVVMSTVDFARPVLDLPDLVAIFACSDDAGWQHLADAWQAAFAPARVALERVAPAGRGPSAEPETILRRALHHVCAGLVGQRAYAGRMALDLAAYRETFETMQRNFAALESHMAAAAPAVARELFHVPQSGRHVDLGRSGAEDGAVEQLLPVDSLGVGDVWIAVAAKPAGGGPALVVSLSAMETGATLARWSVAPDVAGLGWLQLVIDRALTEAALTLRLSVREAEGDAGGGGWAIGLGPDNPYPLYCAMRAGGGSLGAPLAFRVGAVLAGTRVPMTTTSVLQDASPGRTSQLLPPDAYDNAMELAARPDEPAVHHDKVFGFIQVHPRGQGEIAAARLAVAVPDGAWCLSASIELAHEAAQPASFGLLVAPPGGADEAEARLGHLADGATGFSGWFSLSALETRRIVAVLPRRDGRDVVVYLLTRQDGAPAFAWARFSRLAVHFLPA